MLLRAPILLAAAFLLMACEANRSPFARQQAAPALGHALPGARWTLVEVMGQPVDPDAPQAYLEFDAESARVSGSTGCNRLSGNYELADGNRMALGPLAVTMRACMEGMETERAFLDALERMDSYHLGDGRLQLFRARMAPLAVLEARPIPAAD